MKTSFGWILVTLLALTPAVSARAAGAPPAYSTLLRPYEEIRQALVGDELDPVSSRAREIERLAWEASGEPVAGDSSDCRDLLGQIAAAAGELAAARDLDAAREAFGELSKPLVRLRAMAGAEGTVVVFCPMKKKSWLQPPGEIGNPYFGREMVGCGTVLGRD